MKNLDTQQLAVLVYVHAMKKQIEEEIKSKYLKRIDYLVGANNELMHKLEECERECYGRGVQQQTVTNYTLGDLD